ncbi:MAG: LAGLIDADG family homing endonuclease [Patescibacteria group bacterium]
MPRIKFKRGLQLHFLNNIRERLNITWPKLAGILKVHPRTLSDWRREKYTIPEDVFNNCIKVTKNKIEVPPVEVLPDFWNIKKAARKGGQVVAERYGGPGTPEGRAKGGRISQEQRRRNPEKYRQTGCNVRKVFLKPPYSEKLAELVGILLGDGAISNYQVRVSLDRNIDRQYAIFVRNLMHDVLGERPSFMERKEDNVIALTISGAGLVEVLEQIGLKRGNKVAHQVDFPKWVLGRRSYQIACARGLFDTDGGLYFHHKAKKSYLGWCFSNSSKPLIESMMNVLLSLGFNAKKTGDNKIYMYSLEQIVRYMKIVNSHNPKNIDKLKIRIG